VSWTAMSMTRTRPLDNSLPLEEAARALLSFEHQDELERSELPEELRSEVLQSIGEISFLANLAQSWAMFGSFLDYVARMGRLVIPPRAILYSELLPGLIDRGVHVMQSDGAPSAPVIKRLLEDGCATCMEYDLLAFMIHGFLEPVEDLATLVTVGQKLGLLQIRTTRYLEFFHQPFMDFLTAVRQLRQIDEHICNGPIRLVGYDDVPAIRALVHRAFDTLLLAETDVIPMMIGRLAWLGVAPDILETVIAERFTAVATLGQALQAEGLCQDARILCRRKQRSLSEDDVHAPYDFSFFIETLAGMTESTPYNTVDLQIRCRCRNEVPDTSIETYAGDARPNRRASRLFSIRGVEGRAWTNFKERQPLKEKENLKTVIGETNANAALLARAAVMLPEQSDELWRRVLRLDGRGLYVHRAFAALKKP